MRPENMKSDFNAHCVLSRPFAIYVNFQLVNHADVFSVYTSLILNALDYSMNNLIYSV